MTLLSGGDNLGIDELLAIVPARGGSKGIPRKNLRLLAGRPLLSYTIDAALRASHVGRVIVSTDDDEIAAIAVASGAEVPFRRPAALGTDDATTFAVVRHALETLMAQDGRVAPGIVVLQPTSPLRTAAHIDAAIDLWLRTRADSVVALRQIEHPLEWAVSLGADARVAPLSPVEGTPTRRQDAAIAYWPNGALYVSRTAGVLGRDALLGPDTRGYVMTAEDSIDIDGELDLLLAEAILSRRP